MPAVFRCSPLSITLLFVAAYQAVTELRAWCQRMSTAKKRQPELPKIVASRASLRNHVNEPENSRESVYLWTIVKEGWAVLATVPRRGKSRASAPKWKDRSPTDLRPPVNDMGEPTEWV